MNTLYICVDGLNNKGVSISDNKWETMFWCNENSKEVKDIFGRPGAHVEVGSAR